MRKIIKRVIVLQYALESLYKTVVDRKNNPLDGSYTAYLFKEGTDKILKRCAEECNEIIISSKNGNNRQTALEISDLIYHITILMADQGIKLDEVLDEIKNKSLRINGLYYPYKIDDKM